SEFGSLQIRPLFDRKVNPNPHHEWVLQELTQWSKGFADQTQRFDEIGCQQRDRMLAIGKFMSMFGYMDQHMGSARSERSAPLMVDMIDKLLDTLLTGCTDQGFDLGRRLLDTLKALDVFMTRDQMTDIREKIKAWFESHRDIHCDYWLQNRFIPYDQYNELRSKESAWLIFRLLIEVSVNYKPTEQVLRYIPMGELLTATTKLYLAAEDYLCLMSKLAANDITTGVMSYASTEKCSLQTALDSHFQLIKHLEAECQSLSTTIATKTGPEFETPALMAYVNALMDTSYGCCRALEVIFRLQVKDGLFWCQKWEQLKRQLLDETIMTSAPVPTFGYWECRGRGQPIRTLLAYAGVNYTDKRYKFSDSEIWGWDKVDTLGLDFPNLPYYIDGNVKMSQSMAIFRYLGQKHGLMATDAADRAVQVMCEQQMLEIEVSFVDGLIKHPDYKARTADYLANTLTPQLDLLVKFLADKQWLTGGQLSYVDFMCYDALDWLRRFTPETIGKYPTIGQYLDRFEALPAIKAYHGSPQYKPTLKTMTTLSLLKNRSEFGSLKIRPLFDRKVNPNPHHEWVSQELIQWSKGFADQNQRFDEMSVLFASYMYSGCQQRDRMLAMCKFSSFTMYLDYATETARRERSAPLMVELIEKLLTTVLTGRTDNDFVLGRRLLDTMEAVDVFMTRDQMRQLRDNLNVWFESQREVHCDYWLQNRFIPYNQYYHLRSKES
ncbi:unnamed protein product, partial [Medioppia subpectinata]